MFYSCRYFTINRQFKFFVLNFSFHMHTMTSFEQSYKQSLKVLYAVKFWISHILSWRLTHQLPFRWSLIVKQRIWYTHLLKKIGRLLTDTVPIRLIFIEKNHGGWLVGQSSSFRSEETGILYDRRSLNEHSKMYIFRSYRFTNFSFSL